MNLTRTFFCGLCGLAAFATSARGQDFLDTVLLADGTRDAKVAVVSENWETVVYKLPGGTEKSVAAEGVLDVEYGNAPREFRGGFDQWRRGNFEGAVERLSECLERGSMGPAGTNLLGAQARYYTADSLLALGTSAHCRKAAGFFREVLEDAAGAEGRFAFRAQLGLGEALLGAGDLAGARAAFQALAGDSRLESLPEPAKARYRALAQVGLADVVSAEGKPQDAQSLCSNAASVAAAAGPDIDSLVRIRTAEIQVAANQAAAVRSQYERAAEEAAGVAEDTAEESRRAFAIALVATGLAKMGDKGEAIRAKEHFARVCVHFHTQSSCHAAALYWAGVHARRLQAGYEAEASAAKDEDAKGTKEQQAEAAGSLSTKYFRSLLDLHPRSRWARRVRAGDVE